MKLVKFLDQKGTLLVSDPLNQTILKNLVTSEYSISDLALKLNIPTLKLWRKMQTLLKANMIELVRTEKIGNLEKKYYRAIATGFIPQQLMETKAKDKNLQEAFDLYSQIQNQMMTIISKFGDVPKDVDPIDYAMFANMYAFADVFAESTTQTRLLKLKKKLAEYQKNSRSIMSLTH